ncbi:hypothetical protein GCM10027277_34410 [Pseudoduganella ginsengisoli]|uniref:Uncharacterized protein n=1 Tax=Pseudoduganella ginsengisoli TaxID=1462440 RepID=A0A6L6Q8M8_9BURK|nr:hypothetical protein [Pseudoduganella ginsengisoli]MTW05572.1 hypothetical protein [Pseudoduganella ginsengisoli]
MQPGRPGGRRAIRPDRPAGQCTAGHRLEFTARSWLLTHFTLASEDNRARLARYLNLANRDIPAPKAFETAFGITPDQLGEKLWRYRLSSVKVLQVDVPDLPAAQITYTSLPDTVTSYALMAATLTACPDRATGEALLRKMTAQATPSHHDGRTAGLEQRARSQRIHAHGCPDARVCRQHRQVAPGAQHAGA